MKELNFERLGERVYYETLSSGLTVYVIPKQGFSKSFAFFATHYGGWDEHFAQGDRWRRTPAGVAHFLEHKMFDMPEGNALQTFAAAGASPNAFTSGDVTGYYFTCTDGVYDNLRTLLKMVTTPHFTPESVAKEQGIIAQEIHMIEDDPDWQCYQSLLQALYEHHPIRNSIAGTVESIGKISPEILEACHKTFYHPGNMVLCVAGNVEPREVLQLAAALVPSAGKQNLRRDHGEEEKPMAFCQMTELEMEVSEPKFMLGFKAEPKGTLKCKLTGELAAELLAGESSPLYAKLYQEGLIDKRFGVQFDSDNETAHFLFAGESRDPGAVAEAIINEAIRIDWNGLDRKLLERLKKAAYGSRVRALNSFESTCIQMARGHFYGYQYLDFAQLYGEISHLDVEELIRESITTARYALSVVRPKGE